MKRKRIAALITAIIVIAISTAVLNTVPSLKYKVFQCGHRYWENGICSACGKVCDHEQYEEGICTACGLQCSHEVFQDCRCAECGELCRHPEYEDGICRECGYRCRHQEYRDGECIFCGELCPHPMYIQDTCVVCGEKCLHGNCWENGICTSCGSKCTHQEYLDGECTVCGYTCPHNTWKNGTCQCCGRVCTHREWKDGACALCGIACEHDHWEKGECGTCHEKCAHTVHNAQGICLICGEHVSHDFAEGMVCSVCGKPLSFLYGQIPDEAFAEVPEKGTVEYVDYDSVRYATGEPIVKHMEVYLPYGYNEGTKYNLLIMMPGMGATETYFFANEHNYNDGTDVYLKDMFDNAIYNGVCEPLIAVAVSWCDAGSYTEPMNSKDYNQVAKEMRNIILPYIADHYSVYAPSGAEEDLITNRDHVAFYGLSYGALMIQFGVLPGCYDMIGSYAFVSSASESMDYAASVIGESGLPMKMFLCGYGSDEISKATTHNAYATLQYRLPEIFRDGVNSFEIECPGFQHTLELFDTMLYNTLLSAFKN